MPTPREQLDAEVARLREDDLRRLAAHEAEGGLVRNEERARSCREEERREYQEVMLAQERAEREAEMRQEEAQAALADDGKSGLA
jgi:hypothetical protein